MGGAVAFGRISVVARRRAAGGDGDGEGEGEGGGRTGLLEFEHDAMANPLAGAGVGQHT